MVTNTSHRIKRQFMLMTDVAVSCNPQENASAGTFLLPVKSILHSEGKSQIGCIHRKTLPAMLYLLYE